MVSLEIADILKNSKTIAVVGLSPKENRASNQVASYLIDAGYTVIPVNPGQDEILGQKCYPNLKEIPVKVDVVDIFRKPEDIPPVVEEAIAVKAETVWMQLGISNEQAASMAHDAGLKVIMDRCIKIDHMNL